MYEFNLQTSIEILILNKKYSFHFFLPCGAQNKEVCSKQAQDINQFEKFCGIFFCAGTQMWHLSWKGVHRCDIFLKKAGTQKKHWSKVIRCFCAEMQPTPSNVSNEMLKTEKLRCEYNKFPTTKISFWRRWPGWSLSRVYGALFSHGIWCY